MSALAVEQAGQFVEEATAIAWADCDLFGVWAAEAIANPLLLQSRAFTSLAKKASVKAGEALAV